MPKQLKLKQMQRPGGYTVFAGKLPLAQFFESVTTEDYQSPKLAKARARLLISALRKTGEFS